MCADSGWRNHMDQSPPLVSIWHLTDQEQFALGMPSMLKRDSTRCHHFDCAHIGCHWYPYCRAFGAEGGGGLLFLIRFICCILVQLWMVYSHFVGLCVCLDCTVFLIHVHDCGMYIFFWLVPFTCNFKQGIVSVPPWITTSVFISVIVIWTTS